VELPLVLGTPEDFAAVRDLLGRAGYTETEVARRCGVPSIYAFRTLHDGRTAAAGVGDAFDALLHLFLDEEALPWEAVRALLGDDGVRALRALGLLTDADEAGCARATVLLYPTRSLVVASDRTRWNGEMPHDVVYPAITTSTERFVTMLPESPTGDLLELCAGTGIAALLGARFSAHAWATDVTERAAHFARFNARLNDAANVTVACGDLYAAIGDRAFDRIVAHPPYVSGAEVRVAFRDGGEDGEQVTRGVVAGLPAHLRPGGSLHCTCAVTDRKGRPFERRMREWLGDAERDFDVFFFPQASHDPRHYFLDRAIGGHEAWSALQRHCESFARLEIERVVYGSFVVRRRPADAGDPGPPLTVRRRATPATRARDVERLIARETILAAEARQPDGDRHLLALPLATGADVTFALTHALVDGDWQAVSCHVRLAAPFVIDADVAPWIAALLARCDGTRPAEAVVRELQAEGMAPGDALADLPPLVRALVGAGILEARR
jgi:methylase of polypeptide subunit release factors